MTLALTLAALLSLTQTPPADAAEAAPAPAEAAPAAAEAPGADAGVDAAPAQPVPPPAEAEPVSAPPPVEVPDAGAPPPPAPVPAPVPAPAPPADAPVAATPGAEAMSPSAGFVKGELSVYLGGDRLVVKKNRIGVSAGLDRFGDAFYLLLEPLVDLRFFDGKLGLGVGVPLRLELFSFDGDASGPYLFRRAGRFRREDWLRFHDYGRLLKYVTYGRKEDTFYVNVGQRYATTLGHGAIMRRYAPNIDIDYPRVSVEVDAYNKYAGFELMTNDLLEWNMLGGLAFLKPLAFFNDRNVFTRSLSLGVTAAVDITAPQSLQVNELGVRQLDGTRFRTNNLPVGLLGFDAEAKVIKTDQVDLKPYVDYSMLLGGDGGLTVGALARINLGTKVVNAFRLVAEFRYLGDRYQPSYFDTFYEVERFIAGEDPRLDPDLANYFTKRARTLRGFGQRFGYYFEASWGIRDAIGFTVALEGVSNSAEKNFVAHLEIPFFSWLQVFGSYYKRGFVHFAEFAQNDRSVVFAGARLKILPVLFLNGRLYKTFRVNTDLQRYDNQFGFVVDLEIGYEFGWPGQDKPKTEATAAPTGNTPATEAPSPPPAGG